MEKKAIIEIALVEECSREANDAVAQEILNEIAEGKTFIPWCKQVKKVVVSDKDTFF